MNTRALLPLVLTAGALMGQVTSDRLLHSDREPQNWLTYSGSYSGQRHSLLTNLTRDNVKNLTLKWIYNPKYTDITSRQAKMENTPLVADGIMYTGTSTEIVALDAVTGRTFWTYRHVIDPKGVFVFKVNKGVALAGDTVFWATIDCHLIAIDAKTGREIWDKKVVEWSKGYQFNVAPLVVKDKVILGPATNEEGANCWVAAYDVKTGKELWRFDTAPNSADAPGAATWPKDSWKHGGSPVWVTGSYDPETNLTFWGTGNPNPGWSGDVRAPGDNLYSDSVVALDADTGKLKWHYQFTPGDEYDWDSVQVPVLVNIDYKGKPLKGMLWANRNGFFYVLDRTTGKFLSGTAFVKQNWNLGFDEVGRPMKAPGLWPKPMGGVFVEPGTQGGTNWYSPSFSPKTGLFYVSSWENSGGRSAKGDAGVWKEGERYTGTGPRTAPAGGRGGGTGRGVGVAYKNEQEGYGAIRALDPGTGAKKWEFKMVDYTESGIVTTASDLLFSGGREGNFVVLDARNGQLLWHTNLGGNSSNGPITYAVNGRQYVAISSEGLLYVFGLPE